MRSSKFRRNGAPNIMRHLNLDYVGKDTMPVCVVPKDPHMNRSDMAVSEVQIRAFNTQIREGIHVLLKRRRCESLTAQTYIVLGTYRRPAWAEHPGWVLAHGLSDTLVAL